MQARCMIAALMLAVLAAQPLAAEGVARTEEFELRTWATIGSAPEDGPISSSLSFDLRSRFGGPFIEPSLSHSFRLWGGGAYSPVEGALLATATESRCVTLHWTVASLADVEGLNIYRAPSEDGPFVRLNDEILPAESPGVYEDRTVWPASQFWYDLRVVAGDGSEESVGAGPVPARTGGKLETKLHALAPNPFSAETRIVFEVPGVPGGARLTVFDVSGKVVRTFREHTLTAGRHEVVWDGTNDARQRVASGVYFLSLQAGSEREKSSLVLLR